MKYDFGIDVTTQRRTGDVLAVYFQIRKGSAAKVREFGHGDVLANYNDNGELLGIEMLAPCAITVLDKITENEPDTQKFVRRSVPREMAIPV